MPADFAGIRIDAQTGGQTGGGKSGGVVDRGDGVPGGAVGLGINLGYLICGEGNAVEAHLVQVSSKVLLGTVR